MSNHLKSLFTIDELDTLGGTADKLALLVSASLDETEFTEREKELLTMAQGYMMMYMRLIMPSDETPAGNVVAAHMIMEALGDAKNEG